MGKNNKNYIDWEGVIFVVAWMAVFAIIMFSACSCGVSKEYKSSVSEFRDTVYVVKSDVRVDSIWRDRVQYVEVRGDSVVIRDSVVVEKWRYRNVGDTLWKLQYIYLSDTIEVQSATVVRERSGYDKFCSWAFWIIVALALVYLVVKVVRWFVKK